MVNLQSPALAFVVCASLGMIACAGRDAEAPARSMAQTESMKQVREITLPPPAPEEAAGLRKGGKDEPLKVGFGRSIPQPQQVIALQDLDWSRTPEGRYRATVAVRSSGAKSVRLGLTLSKPVPGLTLGFAGSERPASTVDAAQIAAQSGAGTPYWSPVVQGDVVTLELTAPQLPERGPVLQLLSVSHIP